MNKISASLMCADLARLREEIKKLEAAGVDWLHVDIMDGHFAPNFTFGPDFVKAVRKITKLPLDIHLMVKEPEKYINVWQTLPGDIISFHIESKSRPQKAIELIKAKQCRPALALNPGTLAKNIFEYLSCVDMVLVMTVNPGFAGQKWIPETLDKVKQIRGKFSGDIEVDGNIGSHNIAQLRKAGANVFVAGTASVFKSPGYGANTQEMREHFTAHR